MVLRGTDTATGSQFGYADLEKRIPASHTLWKGSLEQMDADSVFVERLWRTVKYEEVYLRADASVSEAR